MMDSIRPFKINVSESAIGRLHQKLELTNFPSELDAAGWEYGVPLPDIKRLAAHWRNGFDWKLQEAKLNELPQFKTKVMIDGFEEVDMHFVHQKSEVAGAIPLLFVHGWPGSFIEVSKLLPLLRENKDGPSFHVVAPSLPNFGFSSRVTEVGMPLPIDMNFGSQTQKGFRMAQYAEACHKVMIALGYDKYVTQGGDWGFMITRALAHLFPQHVMALHTNWALAPFPSFTASPIFALTSLVKHALGSYFYTARESADLVRAKEWTTGSGRGYFALLSTKPQTISYSLSDSPVGLLAFVYEKLHDWTDNYPWTDDEILTWISIYWFSEAGPGASGFIYREREADKIWTMERLGSYVDKPLGFHYFPRELVNLPKAWLKGMGNVIYVGESDNGGHFAAWEKPEAIAADLGKMFGKGGGAFDVVEGRSGY